MGCGCNKNKTRYQVVANGKVVFQSTSRETADSVSRRYAGSTVHELAATG